MRVSLKPRQDLSTQRHRAESAELRGELRPRRSTTSSFSLLPTTVPHLTTLATAHYHPIKLQQLSRYPSSLSQQRQAMSFDKRRRLDHDSFTYQVSSHSTLATSTTSLTHYSSSHTQVAPSTSRTQAKAAASNRAAQEAARLQARKDSEGHTLPLMNLAHLPPQALQRYLSRCTSDVLVFCSRSFASPFFTRLPRESARSPAPRNPNASSSSSRRSSRFTNDLR